MADSYSESFIHGGLIAMAKNWTKLAFLILSWRIHPPTDQSHQSAWDVGYIIRSHFYFISSNSKAHNLQIESNFVLFYILHYCRPTGPSGLGQKQTKNNRDKPLPFHPKCINQHLVFI
jgi:hypothetical protein